MRKEMTWERGRRRGSVPFRLEDADATSHLLRKTENPRRSAERRGDVE